MAVTNFHNFPDNLILEIFSYVSPTDLCNLYHVNDQFKRLAFDRTLVRHCDFEKCYMTKDVMLTDFIKCSCHYIESLSLNHCYWITGKTIETLIPKCKNIRKLSLLDISLTTKRICKILSSLPKLEALAFTIGNIDDFDNHLNSNESAQKQMCQIKHLTIHFKVGITPRTEQAISVQFIQKKTSFFEHCRNLTELNVIGHPNLGCGLPKLLVQPNVVKIENLKHLKVLSLNYAIDPAARIFYYGTLLSVAKLQLKLHTVLNPSANFENHIRNDFWRTFWNSQEELRNLDLSNTSLKNVFPTVFDSTVVRNSLVYLNISDTDNKDSGMSLRTLGHVCPNLQALNVRNSHLVYVASDQNPPQPDHVIQQPQSMNNFDIDGFSTLVNLCQNIVHLNISNTHIHQLNVSDRFCHALTQLKGLQSLAVSPCCFGTRPATQSHDSKTLEKTGIQNTGMKRAASTILMQYGKRKRIAHNAGVDSNNQPVASTSSAADPVVVEDLTPDPALDTACKDLKLLSLRTGLQLLTDACTNLTHFELINAGLMRPVIHRGQNGLMPKPCLYIPCAESYIVTDRELMYISKLKNLRYLQLAGLPGIITGSFLSVIAKECPKLSQLHLAYLGLTAHCIYIGQLCQAFSHFTHLQDLRLEHAYLSIDSIFCKAAQRCTSLQRLCVVSKNGSIDSGAVIDFVSKLPSLVVLQLFTDATQYLCKKLQKSLKERFESCRPALSVSIWPLFDQDTAHVMNTIPTKHLEELTIFSSKVAQRPHKRL